MPAHGKGTMNGDIEKRFQSLWLQLQGKKPHLKQFLTEIHLKGIRGIVDLRVVFDYPVSVVAGGNASGKSTLLFAAACAYKVPGAGVRDFVPSTLFPDYSPGLGRLEDEKGDVVMEFDYVTATGRTSMCWKRERGWSRSFFGRNGAKQPERPIYLRTLSNLSNPSEARGVLSMARMKSAPTETPLTASQIDFAQRVLPFRYAEVVALSSGRKNLLFAAQERGPKYSELHMAAGERAVLRLSREVSLLQDALVLIDEVEAGLHPWIQQLLMLQFQQLALRNNLQIIVTSHSPVVLDAVPPHARIFLERDDAGGVSVRPPYHDIVQSALYGRSNKTLNLLCEDDAADGILQGVFDELLRKEEIDRGTVRIGRDTGAEQFPAHAAAFRKFGQIGNFVFVLDGDQRSRGVAGKIKKAAEGDVPVLFLPGDDAPEVWTWRTLRKRAEETAERLGVAASDLLARMARLDALYDSASDSQSEIDKTKLHNLAEFLSRSVPDVCRQVARLECRDDASAIQPLVAGLQDAIAAWRNE